MFEDLAKDLLMAACYDGSAFSLAERTATGLAERSL